MSLALTPAPAWRCSGYRRRAAAAAVGVAVLVAALALGLAVAPGRAQDVAGAGQAFSATVPVDATADSVVKAREMARFDGQRRALDAVAERLGGAGAPAKLPKLSDQAITDLVASFAVANERMSAVRYLADYTFHFRPDAVGDLLSKAGIALAAQPGNPGAPDQPPAPPPAAAGAAPDVGAPVVVLPVWAAGAPAAAVLWEDPNPWRDAWDQLPASDGPVHLVVPLGDAGDLAAIDAAAARAGNAQALAAEASGNGGDEAIVALAVPQGPPDEPAGVAVTARDYRAGRFVAAHVEPPLAANPGESREDLLRRAAAATAIDIEGGWKKAQPAASTPGPPAPATAGGPESGQEESLTAVLPIDSLHDWVQTRARLGDVPEIRKLALVALSRQQATVEIDYVGSLDQLKSSLAQISLDLVQGDPLWRLSARSGSGQPH
jgi:hypothetical protein